MRNTLFYGDNLKVLRERIDSESVDLVYLDPPFNSNASYNVLFKEKTGEESPAQIKAFTDTWQWTEETERAFYQDIVHNSAVPSATKEMIDAFRRVLGDKNDMMAYLVMMAPRLVELRRVLKPTGSLYLHCDPTASHYLKVLLDTIFGPRTFVNEIIWKRSSAHSDARQGARHFGRVSDTLLFYSKADNRTWNQLYGPYDSEYIERDYRRIDESGRRYRISDLSGPGGAAKGNPYYEFLGVKGYWRYSKERMEQLYREGRIIQTRPGAVPQYKRYLDEMPGVPIQNIWTDVPVINNRSSEKLGYPTQKPEALLERIIQASSNQGDVVLDPFCGCGTAVAAAEKLKRQWIGIDITHLAVALMKNRLKTMFNLEPGRGKDYDVVGEPEDVGSARAKWEQDPYEFQLWAVGLVEAQPQPEQKRGADRGIDGLLYFIDGPRRTAQKVVIQVKGGHVSSPQVRELKGVVEREKAALGLFISLEEATRDMRTEAASGGFYHSDLWQRDYPKIQLRTIQQLLSGQGFELPPRQAAYQAAERVRPAEGRQSTLEDLASA